MKMIGGEEYEEAEEFEDGTGDLGNNGGPVGRRPPDGENKIFVGGIGELSQERFDEYFSLYGDIVDSVVMKDKATGRSRGFGFVQYASAEAADQVIQDAAAHSIDGQKFEVKRCNVPRTAKKAPRATPYSVPVQRGPAMVQRARPSSRPAPAAAWGPALGTGRMHAPRAPLYAAPSPMMTDKVFVGGVGECHEELFVDYFGRYGGIVDVVVMRDKTTGKSRGFGFVQFETPQAVDAIMQHGQPPHVDGRMVEISGNHYLNGKQVEVKRSIPKEVMAGAASRAPAAYAPAAYAPAAYAPPVAYAPPASRAPKATIRPPRPNKEGRADKVFVGGLGDCSEEEFVAYFEQFGTLIDHVVMKDKVTGKSRGFGFVQYDDPAAVDEIMARYTDHQINGKWVEVKRCVPEEKGDGKSSHKGGKAAFGGKGLGKGPASGSKGGKGAFRFNPYGP